MRLDGGLLSVKNRQHIIVIGRVYWQPIRRVEQFIVDVLQLKGRTVPKLIK